MTKSLILGTAQWGWGIDRNAAFALLETWLKAGLSEIDAATNYPINRNPADFRASEGILKAFIDAHGLNRALSITMKVGSMDNMRGPEVNLSPSFLRMMTAEYQRLLGGNLGCIMVHWDNRNDLESIAQTVQVLSDFPKKGIRPGLSGIKFPDIYQKVNEEFRINFDIEVKHNAFASDLSKYQVLNKDGAFSHRFLAYGVNAGGVKLSGQYNRDSTFELRGGQHEQYAARIKAIEARLPKFNTAAVRPPIITMNQLGMLLALQTPAISGVLIGARTPAQIAEAIEIRENAMLFDYSDISKLVAVEDSGV